MRCAGRADGVNTWFTRNGFSWSLEIDLDGTSQLAITLSYPYPNVSPRSRIRAQNKHYEKPLRSN